jgi:hypothetical protein
MRRPKQIECLYPYFDGWLSGTSAWDEGREFKNRREMVLPLRIELRTSPLPMECSTTELRQHLSGEHDVVRNQRPLFGIMHGWQRISDHWADVEPSGGGLMNAWARPIDKPWRAARRVKTAAKRASGRATRRAPNGFGRRSGKTSSAASCRSKDGPKKGRGRGPTPARTQPRPHPTIPPDSYRTSPRIRPIILTF